MVAGAAGTTEAKQISGEPSKQGALRGLKVVEFVQLIAGPFAGTLLADLGADVVRVEPPKSGDAARQIGLIWAIDRPMAPAVLAFRDFVSSQP